MLCQLSYLAANERIYIRCGGFSQYGEYPAPGSQPLASFSRLKIARIRALLYRRADARIYCAGIYRAESRKKGVGMSTRDWQDAKNKEVFESTLRGLERRRKSDASFSLADAESALSHLYILDGNDWLGRGELGDIVSQATIAAHEHFIAEWRKELPNASAPHPSGGQEA